MELVGLHVYALVWSILLGSPGIHGLSLYKGDGFPETNGEMDKNVTDSASTSKPYTVISLNTSLTTPGNGQDNHTSSLYVSLSKDPTTLDGLHGKESNVTAGRGPSQNDTTRDTLELNPVEKGNPPVEYGILTVSMSTADDISGVTSPFRNTTEPNQTEDGTNTTIKDGNNLSKVNTVEMLTTNPRTSVLKAGDDLPTTTTISVDPAATSNPETTFKGDAVLGITSVMLTSSRITEVSETSWRSSGDINKMDFPFTAESDEWDDTKITTPLPMNITTQSDIITSHETTMLPTGVGAEVRASLPLSTDSHAATGISEEVFSVPHVDISMDHLARNMSSPVQVLADTELGPTTSQNPGSPSSYAGVTLQMSDVTETTVTTAILTDAAPEKTTGEFNGSDQPGEPVTDVLLPSTTAEETPEAGKAVTPEAGKAVTPEAGKAVTPTSSQMNVMFPPAIRVAAAAGDVLEKHNSEEGDEEDDEEEDDDEDEEEEEEDDDKYTDSVNESVEGDSDLPPFTLPGLVSQESLEDKSNVVLMDGASYQVPDTQEWEQQNQGLVRSWMEKLKGKAGYMSGMLAPVGVGIGGALTILAVLYSVKIINRRRRNGFKQHKRKPREFSGMQDRVMLLADSSEDEF